MLFEIGSIIVASILSLTGMPALAVDANASLAPLQSISCATYDADTCLQSDICEVFILAAGGESCALACDLRDAATCELDSDCQLNDGECGYATDDPVGC